MNSKAKWQYQSYKVYLQKPYLSQAIALVRHVLQWIKGYTLKNKNPNKKDAAILKKRACTLGQKYGILEIVTEVAACEDAWGS